MVRFPYDLRGRPRQFPAFVSIRARPTVENPSVHDIPRFHRNIEFFRFSYQATEDPAKKRGNEVGVTTIIPLRRRSRSVDSFPTRIRHGLPRVASLYRDGWHKSARLERIGFEEIITRPSPWRRRKASPYFRMPRSLGFPWTVTFTRDHSERNLIRVATA